MNAGESPPVEMGRAPLSTTPETAAKKFPEPTVTPKTARPQPSVLRFYVEMLQSADSDLREVAYELRRALTGDWAAEDLPRYVRELLPILAAYQRTARDLVKSVEEAFADEEAD